MRILVRLTLIGSILLSAPTLLWVTGVPPANMVILRVAAMLLVGRLLMLSARFAERGQDVAAVGGFAGVAGSLTSQILLHTPTASASLAAAFAGYGPLGARMYQWDVLNHWWPFAMALANGIVYAGLGWIVFRLVRYRKEGAQS
ncbi:MAG: hypothetical protein M0Z53_03160 [Thermaerobacter sp.]|nr:hypothetical protein [Thermaerobacter sp.]